MFIKLRFELIAEIGSLVIKEFYIHTVRQPIFEIDVLADESVQPFNLRYTFDMKGVDLIDQLFLKASNCPLSLSSSYRFQ